MLKFLIEKKAFTRELEVKFSDIFGKYAYFLSCQERIDIINMPVGYGKYEATASSNLA